MAGAQQDFGDLVGAEAEYTVVIAVQHVKLGDEHQLTLRTRHSLARVLQDLGDLAAAKAEFKAVLAMERVKLGDEHASTLATSTSLAWRLPTCYSSTAVAAC